MSLPNRRGATHVTKIENPVWVDPDFAEQYPALSAFLCASTYSDGTQRVTGSLSIFNKYGSLIVAVNDNDRGLTAFLSHSTWEEVMFALNEGIAKDNLDWRKKAATGFTQKPPY